MVGPSDLGIGYISEKWTVRLRKPGRNRETRWPALGFCQSTCSPRPGDSTPAYIGYGGRHSCCGFPVVLMEGQRGKGGGESLPPSFLCTCLSPRPSPLDPACTGCSPWSPHAPVPWYPLRSSSLTPLLHLLSQPDIAFLFLSSPAGEPVGIWQLVQARETKRLNFCKEPRAGWSPAA